MFKILTTVFAICCLLSLYPCEASSKISTINKIIKVDEMAPDFNVEDTHGKSVKLSDLKGKIVVLEWTNSGCPFVRKHYDTHHMQTLQKDYTDKGVVWISIISSAPGKEGHKTPDEANEQVLKDESHASHVVLDLNGQIGHSYGAKTTPHMFVLDREGKIVYMGAIDDKPGTSTGDIETARNYVVDALDAVLAGKEVQTKVTDSYGCSVKYAN